MMTVQLLKPHKQNGVELPKGDLCRVPYKLGRAMCEQGYAVAAPRRTAELKKAQAEANTKKAEAKAQADAKKKIKK